MTFVEHQGPMREQSIPERFEEMVARFPDRLAIKCAGRSFSYEELDRASNRIARSLLTVENVGCGSVALLFDHGVNVIVAMMGALKAGKQVCILDSRAPEVRMKFIIDDCRISAILTDTEWCDLAQKVFCNYRNVLNIDEIDQTISPAKLGLPIAPSHTAFIAYTSGSTGQPRGVFRTHQERVARAISSGRSRNLCGDDRLSLLHSVAFGSGGADLFMALLNGVAILPFDIAAEGIPHLMKWLKDERITVFHSPPAVFRELKNVEISPDHFTHLRLIRLSGAPITERDFELYKRKFARDTLLEVGMGSTEIEAISNAVVNHDFLFPKQGSPIGYAREDRELLILDDEGQEVATGGIGEIAVRSREFSEDFRRQRDLPEGKFRRDPKDTNALVYLTGDMGTQSIDGFVIHLGRKDYMVKIRGYRVELGEIESAIASHPDVKDVGVVAWDRDPGEKYLVAYVMARQHLALSVSDLNEFLKKKLPDYMIPSAFLFLDSLPLTNGKLDRLALPKPDDTRPELSTPRVAPRDEVEDRLVQLWQKVLNVRPVGINDNFFDLGGHSLSGSRLVSLIHKEFKFDLPVSEFFAAPTIAQLAQRIEGAGKENPGPGKKAWTYLCELQRGEGRKPVFIFPGGGGGEPEFFVYGFLARHVGTEYPFYGLRARGADGILQPHTSVAQMADAYVEEIRAIQPEGPYFLVGECAGGVNAYEAARQLSAQGQEIAMLVLLDVERPRLTKYFRFRAGRCLKAMNKFWIRRRWRENYYLARIPFHLKQLRSLGLNHYPEYFLGRFSNAIKPTERQANCVDSPDQRAAIVLQTGASGQALQHTRWVRENYRRTVRRFHPKLYAGHIEIIVSEKLNRHDPTLGWKKLALEGLSIHPVNGDHRSYIREHVAVAGLKLRECLERAEKERGTIDNE